MHLRRKLAITLCGLALFGAGIGLAGNNAITPHNHNYIAAEQSVNTGTPTQQQADAVIAPIKSQVKGNVQWNGAGAYTINGDGTGNSDLNTNVSSAPYVTNDAQDNLGRPHGGKALLNKTTRQYQTRDQTGNGANNWEPVGWHQLFNLQGTYNHLYDRGHLIGYALAGGKQGFDASEHNPQNVATQTAWANEARGENATGQNYYEGIVRKALDQNKTVLYRVTPLYNGSELVPRANWIEAKSTDGSVNINVLVPNCQNGVNINYQTGEAKVGNQAPANNTQNNSQPANNNAQANQAGQQSGENNQGNANQQSKKPTPTLPGTGYETLLHRLTNQIANWLH